MTKHEVLDLIDRFAAGTCSAFEWDDFISIRQSDSTMESIRLFAARLPDTFPPTSGNVYCGKGALEKLREYINSL